MWELAKLGIVQNIGWTNNSKITNFLSQILVFQIEKNLEICWSSSFDNSKKISINKKIKFKKFLNSEKYLNFINFQFYKLSYILSVQII